jgi:hypothetical protein
MINIFNEFLGTRCKACDVELFDEYMDDELCAICLADAMELVSDLEEDNED